ncbi:MAG: helicase-related protein [Myxococcota bacterium]
MVLSTYPTMLNRINDVEGGERQFGPGYFDLVIVDDRIGRSTRSTQRSLSTSTRCWWELTATPREEIHHDTYGIFDLEPGVPSFAYELDAAIEDGFLVPPRGVSVPFKFIQAGVKYAELSAAEKEEYEEKVWDEDERPGRVEASKMFRWLFNADTVDKALALLMEQGLKIEGGDRLGKTIVFARNHDHAEYIVERFDRSNPKYKGKFAQVIDSHNDYAQSLLDDFGVAEGEPTIAVSVDMLDTGVDVPEVLNLVFFKSVRSRVKFNQMIGRGTRLCADLFGPGKNKEEFLVFDLCGNFEFFDADLKRAESKPGDALSARLVKARIELALLIDASEAGESRVDDVKGKYLDGAAVTLRCELLDWLHQHVATMEPGEDDPWCGRRRCAIGSSDVSEGVKEQLEAKMGHCGSARAASTLPAGCRPRTMLAGG